MDDRMLQVVKNDFTIGKAIDTINLLEDNRKLERGNKLVKWKSFQNQVVIESDDFFYKIYERPIWGLGPFNSLLRNSLAKVYSEIGIYWRIVSFERNEKIFDFEQRQKLDRARDHFDEFGEVLLSFSSILSKVEDDLGFCEIVKLLRTLSDFKDLEQMKIMRFCTNKFDDYATFHKQAILLDDADFYVVLLNKNGEQIKLDKMIDVPVTICGEHYIFTNFVSSLNERESEERVLQGVYGATYGWCFIKEKQGGRATPQTEIMNPEKKKAIIKSKSSAGLLREKKVGDVASNIEVVEAEMRNRLLSEPQDSNSKIFFRNSV